MLNKLKLLIYKLRYGREKIISNLFWLVFDKILPMTLGLFITVAMARYLGPKSLGQLSFAFSYVHFFDFIANLGLPRIVVKELAKDPSKRETTIGTALVIKLVSSSGVFLFTIVSIKLLRPDDLLVQTLVVVSAVGVVFQAFDIIDLWFESDVNSKYIVWVKSSVRLIVSFLRIGLVWLRTSLFLFAWMSTLEYVFLAIGRIGVYRLQGYKIRQYKFSFGRAKELLSESWPLIISGLVVTLYMRIDVIMLGQMIGDQAVGLYSPVVRLSEAWYFIPGAIIASFFPSLVRSRGNDPALYRRRLQKLLDYLTLISYGIAITVTIFSDLIVSSLFGASFSESAPVLSIHIWGGVFVVLGMARSQFFVVEGLTKYSPVGASVGGIFNVVANYFWIPTYGIMGAAVATVISQFIASYAIYILFPRTRDVVTTQTKSLLMLNIASVVFAKLKKEH